MLKLLRQSAFLFLTILSAVSTVAGVFGFIAVIWAAIALGNFWLLFLLAPVSAWIIASIAGVSFFFDESIS